MINLDKLNQTKTEIANALASAIRNNDEEGIKNAMNDFQNFMSETITNEAVGIIETADTAILGSRGIRQLTSAENQFYKSFIANAKNSAADGSVIGGIADALPETVIESIFDDLKSNHPLLDAISFTNTSAITKMILNKQGTQTATWDELNEPITEKLKGEIEVVSTTLYKLTAYMWVTMDMLDLGPAWVDRYVRETISEALATGLETAIVDGDGIKKPIGFTRNFAGALEPTTGYARKDAVKITDFSKETYGSLLSVLSVNGRTQKERAVREVILVCNPSDYFTKIMPASTILTPQGTYVNNVFPFPTKVIQSVGVPKDHAVIGLADYYFMGLGSSKSGKLEYSDDYKFLEDTRTYKIKLYGTGRPLDINAFLYLDVSGIEDVTPVISTKTVKNADLTSLSVGFDLTPSFDRDVTSYTATASGASSIVFATPKDGDATIEIKNGNAVITNGSSVSWTNNAVTQITINVTNGSVKKTYTVDVTRGTPT